MGFIVTEKAQRPANMNGKCFYCHMSIGTEHRNDCVLVLKEVIIRMTINYLIKVPAFWDKHMIEFQRNEGSLCQDIALEELKTLSEERDCLCGLLHFECLEDRGIAFLEEE